MEPKLQGIKEEVPEREQPAAPPQLPSPAPSKTSSAPAQPDTAPQRTSRPTKGSPRDTPDSPEGAQQPPSTSVPASSSSSSGSSKGSPPASGMGVLNGSSPPGSLNGMGSGDSPSPPSASISTPAPVAAPALLLEARQLAKMRRFLTTIVQFGADVSTETGDRVRSLVLALVSNSLGVEEFQRALQATFNFPLRPFVLPFLRAGIPALQREVAALARHAKQSPQQYLRQHEQLVLDPSFSPSEPSEIFHSLGELHPESAAAHAAAAAAAAVAAKRPRDSYYENGDAEYGPAPKRYHYGTAHGSTGATSTHMGTLFSSTSHHPLLLHTTAGGHHAEYAPPTPSSLLQQPHQPAPHYGYHGGPPAPAPPPSHNGDDARRHGDDEWKNIHVMLNCILSMVEKTKRALAILQHRPPAPASVPEPDFLQSASWLQRRGPPEGAEQQDIKKTAGEIMAQTIKATEDRVAEVRRRAEEAVNEVKRQAVIELQRAVNAAESKAAELVAAERSRMEKLLLEARKQAAVSAANDEASSAPGTHHGDSGESCWNCGRKANETCSGCNTARYCGAFCQHKDWEHHHQACKGSRATTPGPTTSSSAPASSAAPTSAESTATK